MRVGQVEAKARARAVEGPAGTARAADRRHPPVVSEQFELHHFTPRAPAERRRLVAKARGIDLVLDRDVVATIAEGIGNRLRAHAVGAAERKLLHRHEHVVPVLAVPLPLQPLRTGTVLYSPPPAARRVGPKWGR